MANETKPVARKPETINIVDNMLHVNLNVDKGVPSKTGKTVICASTHGFQRIAGTEYRVSVLLTKEA